MTAGRHGGRAGGRLHRLLLPAVRPEVLLPASSSSGNLARDLLMSATTPSRCSPDHSRQQIKLPWRVTMGCGRGSLCCRDGGGEARMMNQCSPALAAAPGSTAGAAAAGVFRRPRHLLLPASTLSCYCLVRRSMRLFGNNHNDERTADKSGNILPVMLAFSKGFKSGASMSWPGCQNSGMKVTIRIWSLP